MAILENMLWTILIMILIIVISSLPLYLAISFLGGRVSILRAFLVMIIVAIVSAVIQLIIPFWGVLISWIVVIWIFREFFRLKWIKAIIAWVLWIIFIIVFAFLFSLLGIGSFFIL